MQVVGPVGLKQPVHEAGAIRRELRETLLSPRRIGQWHAVTGITVGEQVQVPVPVGGSREDDRRRARDRVLGGLGDTRHPSDHGPRDDCGDQCQPGETRRPDRCRLPPSDDVSERHDRRDRQEKEQHGRDRRIGSKRSVGERYRPQECDDYNQRCAETRFEAGAIARRESWRWRRQLRSRRVRPHSTVVYESAVPGSPVELVCCGSCSSAVGTTPDSESLTTEPPLFRSHLSTTNSSIIASRASMQARPK